MDCIAIWRGCGWATALASDGTTRMKSENLEAIAVVK
jgi:hypothetical protein